MDEVLKNQGVSKIKRRVSNRDEDLLDYSIELENFRNIFDKLENSFVISLEAPWGTGKSTFLNILEKELGDKVIIRINAWKEDYLDDPVTSIVFDLGDKLEEILDEKTSKSFKKIGVKLSKDVLPSAISILTSFVAMPGIGKFFEKVVESLVDQIDEKEEHIKELKKALREALEKIQAKQILIFVDELDRCKPTYAVKFLETIKHFFEIDGLVFLLAFEDKVLMQSFKKVYGEEFNSKNYLKRFIDLRLKLEERITHELIKDSFKRNNLDYILSSQSDIGINIEVYYDLLYIYGKYLNLNARDINQIVTNYFLSILLTDISQKNLLLTLFLLTLKQSDSKLYKQYLDENVTIKEFYNDIEDAFFVDFPSHYGGNWKENNMLVIYEYILPSKMRQDRNYTVSNISNWLKGLQSEGGKKPKNEVLTRALENIITKKHELFIYDLGESLSMINATNEIDVDKS